MALRGHRTPSVFALLGNNAIIPSVCLNLIQTSLNFEQSGPVVVILYKGRNIKPLPAQSPPDLRVHL